MLGSILAISAGVGYGVFQSVNRRTLQGMDVFTSTFLNLFLGSVVLVIVTAITEDLNVLSSTPQSAYVNFALAGLIHFVLGWTFLNAAQKQIGAARTGALVGTTPLFGTFIAAVTLAETPTIVSTVGILIIVGGVYLVNSPGKSSPIKPENENMPTWLPILFGLGAAVCWAISPIFIRYGLQELESPLMGVTIGSVASSVVYAVGLLGRAVNPNMSAEIKTDAAWLKLIAGTLVGIATWLRWEALDIAPVAVVLALSLFSVPTVNFVSPLLVGQHIERVTLRVWMGSALIVAGSLILIFL